MVQCVGAVLTHLRNEGHAGDEDTWNRGISLYFRGIRLKIICLIEMDQNYKENI